MKIRHFFVLVLSLLCCMTYGQATFTWDITKTGAKEVTLTVSGTLADGWHVSDRTLTLEAHDGLQPSGGLSESGDGVGQDADGGAAVYKQRFTVTRDDWHLKGYLQYVLCTDKACLAPQTVEFERKGTPASAAEKVAEKAESAAGTGENAADGDGKAVASDSDGAVSAVQEDSVGAADFTGSPAWQPVVDKLKAFGGVSPVVAPQTEQDGGVSLLAFFFLAFAGGLLALLTPCV